MSNDVDKIQNPDFFFGNAPEMQNLLLKNGIDKISDLLFIENNLLKNILGYGDKTCDKIKKKAKNFLSQYKNFEEVGGVPPHQGEGVPNTSNFESKSTSNDQIRPNSSSEGVNSTFKHPSEAIFRDLFEVSSENFLIETTNNLNIIKTKFQERLRWIEICMSTSTSRTLFILINRNFFIQQELILEAGIHPDLVKRIVADFIGLNIIESCEHDDLEYNYMSFKPGIYDHHLRSMKIYKFTEKAKIFFSLLQISNEINLIMNNKNLEKFCQKEKRAFQIFYKKYRGVE